MFGKIKELKLQSLNLKRMAKDKYDFIQELLQNTKITTAQKERVLSLTKEEIKKDSLLEKKLDERVRKLELKIVEQFSNEESVPNKSWTESKVESKLPIHIPSKNLWQFLHDYNQDSILKTTCHEIDSNELENILKFCNTEKYNFQEHKTKIQDQYKNEFYQNKAYFVDHKIKNLILSYLTGKTHSGDLNGWTDEKIKYSWESDELKIWCDKNAELVPCPNDGLANRQTNDGLELQKPFKVNLIKQNQQIRYFSQLVLYFKHLFHIRSDNSLRDIIENLNKIENFDSKIAFVIEENYFPKNLEFFTNVEKLVQAYRILINLIIEVSNKNSLDKPKVALKLKEMSDGVEFSIHHVNSIFQKTIQNTIDRKGSTFNNLIKNQINGMCEFFLKASFGNNNFAQINIWDGEESKSKPLEEFEGVEYILKFNKP